MNKRFVEGELRQGLGAAEQAFGHATGDLDMELRGKIHEVTGRVQSAYGEAKDRAAETVNGLDAFVTERPYLTVAIAVAAGAALGFVLGLMQPKVIVVQPAAGPRT